MAGTLSKAQVDLFHDQGYLAVDGVLGDKDLAPLWQEYTDILDTVAHRLHAEGAISANLRAEIDAGGENQPPFNGGITAR